MKTVLSVVICVFVNCAIVFSSTPAGIYVDNGFDQTTIERTMTRREKREMELEILNLLGLPSRPRRLANAQLKKSAPRFLMDIYKSLVENEHGRTERSADINLSGEEITAIDQSDVIMTFESISRLFYYYYIIL